MNREQQKHRIALVRRGIVAGSLVGSLGVAGYLGTAAHADTATTSGGTTDAGTTTDSTSTDTDQYGDGSTLDPGQLSSGSGTADATTRGS